jgi:hypothetical protein
MEVFLIMLGKKDQKKRNDKSDKQRIKSKVGKPTKVDLYQKLQAWPGAGGSCL